MSLRFSKTSVIFAGGVDELLNKVLDAGRVAPSSKNSQPWKYAVGIASHLYEQNG